MLQTAASLTRYAVNCAALLRSWTETSGNRDNKLLFVGRFLAGHGEPTLSQTHSDHVHVFNLFLFSPSLHHWQSASVNRAFSTLHSSRVLGERHPEERRWQEVQSPLVLPSSRLFGRLTDDKTSPGPVPGGSLSYFLLAYLFQSVLFKGSVSYALLLSPGCLATFPALSSPRLQTQIYRRRSLVF